MSRRYCFTLNNYTDAEALHLESFTDCKYIVVGRELGSELTPHLQGFVIFNTSTRFAAAKSKLGDRCHIEAAKGSSQQAADYCKKDGSFVEWGDFPGKQGKRSDWDVYKDWVLDLGRVPSRLEIVREFPSMYARYKRACIEYAEAITPAPVLTTSEPRLGWQLTVCAIPEQEAHARRITFVVDPEGNSGKSWICQYFLTKYPERTQVLRIGKRDDLSYAIDIDKDIFLFDIPRTQMTYLQYSVLESLKDRMIFSPKYESSFKVLRKIPHVLVFSNEQPDMNTLSRDRYNIINV